MRGREGLDILVVDDDEACLATLGDALESDGHRIRMASRGLEAVDLALRAGGVRPAFDLTILDVNMPDLSGPETYERLVTLWPGLAAIFVSGEMNESLSRRVGGASVVACLGKPLDLLEMRRVIGAFAVGFYGYPGRRRSRARHWRGEES